LAVVAGMKKRITTQNRQMSNAKNKNVTFHESCTDSWSRKYELDCREILTLVLQAYSLSFFID